MQVQQTKIHIVFLRQSGNPYLFATRVVWQFVVGGHVQDLHPGVDGGQGDLRENK